MRCSLVLVGIVVWLSSAAAGAQPTIDGVVDTLYGAARAKDKAGDGNTKQEMDLRDLYLHHDSTHLYVAFSITANVTASGSNWGKYVIYVDTTGDAKGATSDAWTRNVSVADPHKPEYSINTWVDQTPYDASKVQLWSWNGTKWVQSTTGVAAAALKGSKSGTVIEYKIARAALGDPKELWLEVWSTGNGSTDNAQDTINAPAEDWNAANWTTTAKLKVSTHYQLGSAALDAGSPKDAGVPKDVGGIPDQPPTTTDQTVWPLDTSPPPDTTPAKDAKVADGQLDTGPKPDNGGTTKDLGPGPDSTALDTGAGDAGAGDSGASADSFVADADVDGGPSNLPGKQEEGCACGANGANGVNASQLSLSLPLLLVGLLWGVGRRRRR